MKEKEFIKNLEELNFLEQGFIIPINYSLDDYGNIILDVEGMEYEFNRRIKEVLEVLEK